MSIGLQRNNIKRHYDRLHPDIVLQRPPQPLQKPKSPRPQSETFSKSSMQANIKINIQYITKYIIA